MHGLREAGGAMRHAYWRNKVLIMTAREHAGDMPQAAWPEQSAAGAAQ